MPDSTHSKQTRTVYYAQAWVGETLESSTPDYEVERLTLEEAQQDMERWKQNPKVLSIGIYKGKQEFIEDAEAGRAGGYWQLTEYEEWGEVQHWVRPGLQPQSKAGTCYADAWRFVIKEEEGYLIHGTIESEGKRIGHAWVETLTGFIWEPETKKFYNKNVFQATTKAVEEQRYTPDQAAIMAARTRNTGPWTEEERRRYFSQEKSPETVFLKPEPRIITQIPRGDSVELKNWWNETYGSQYVIRTDGKLDGIVKHLGYESLEVPETVRTAVSGAVFTDQDIVDQSQERLRQVQPLEDNSLTQRQVTHLALARAIANEVVTPGNLRGIKAAIIPPASDRVRTAGMYGRTTREAYISPGQLEHGQTTVDTSIHELSHHTSGAEDGDAKHSQEMARIAGKVVQLTAAKHFDKFIAAPGFQW